MISHNVIQGSPEWHALRAEHFNASEAPAMMGESKYMSRAQLIRQKATGVVPEVDAATQRRLGTRLLLRLAWRGRATP